MKTPVSLGYIELDINIVFVEDQSTTTLFGRAGYNDVDSGILNAVNLIHKPGARPMAIFSPGQDVWSYAVTKAMKAMTTVISGKTYKGRAATIEEIAAYEVLFSKQLEKIFLVALGEKIIIESNEHVACRCTNGSERKLVLHLSANIVWPPGYYFLVVFEEIPE